ACGNANQQAFYPDAGFYPQPAMQSFAKSQSSSTITLATYNVRNLFDGIQNPGKAPETAKPEKELIYLGQAIQKIDADVIALQEVESKSTVEKFLNKYVPGHNYKVVLVEAYDARGIDVAILTRFQ